MSNHYDVIIVGCGPVGAALGIELGLNNIHTLILEKHDQPLLSARAQSLNERSMELFMRWGLADELRARSLFPADFKMQGVWCSKLNGKTYATAGSNHQFSKNRIAQQALRIPLYITEELLRKRLADFDCVTLLKNHAVDSIKLQEQNNYIHARDTINQSTKQYSASYVLACDGANSIVRNQLNMPFTALAPNRRVINVLFEAKDLIHQITVEQGFIYMLLENNYFAAIGLVDIAQGIWYAQIVYSGPEQTIEEIDVDQLLETVSGIQFDKKILNKHFWDMQIQCAEHFSLDNRVFLVGDSAHAFAPTGGFGLNTGLGDVTNLAWKIAAVIQQRTSSALLMTYEIERMPICRQNLAAAERNARDAMQVREKFPPDQDVEKFAQENVRIAKQHVHTDGLTLGYTYDQTQVPMKADTYIPTIKPGYFLPNQVIDDESIYTQLSPVHWTLIISGNYLDEFTTPITALDILPLPENTYPSRFVLIRPDWHIALTKDLLSLAELTAYLTNFNQ